MTTAVQPKKAPIRLCLKCVDEVFRGAYLYGPCFGITLVECCEDCSIYATDEEAATDLAKQLGMYAIETAGHWYLDLLNQSRIEQPFRLALEHIRAEAIQERGQ